MPRYVWAALANYQTAKSTVNVWDDSVTIGATPRGIVRTVIAWGMYIVIPIVALLERAGLPGGLLGGAPFWRVWLFFVLGWALTLGVSAFVAARLYTRYTGRGPRDNRILYHDSYGYDIEVWSALASYAAALAIFSVWSTVSAEVRMFWLAVLVASSTSAILSFTGARVVFGQRF